jgi:hypothetical protein
MRHVAIFELEKPLSCPQGSVLKFRLDHADRQHSIGRLRLSATSSKPPIQVPKLQQVFVLQGQVPPTRTGGMLAVTAEFRTGEGQPHWLGNIKRVVEANGNLAGQPAQFESVLNNAGYPVSWQTWRLAVVPSDVPQRFELRLTSSLPKGIEHCFKAHFVAR